MSFAPKLLLAACVALVAMSCSPKHDNTQQQQNANNSSAGQNAAMFENGPRLRIACADEIQKYCANDPRKRRCLRDSLDKLSDSCKAAVDTPRGAGNGRHAGIGRVCATEIAKFCANDDRKFRCLKNNLTQLGDACKAAVSAPREPRQGGTQPADGNP